jgi:hypothetical protein
VLVGNLDSASGLTIGGSVPGARAWQLSAAPNGTALSPWKFSLNIRLSFQFGLQALDRSRAASRDSNPKPAD